MYNSPLIRPSLSTFDYDHEEFPALKGTPLLRRKRPGNDYIRGILLLSFEYFYCF